MTMITEEQYEYALARIEVLLPLVGENTPDDSKEAMELDAVSEIVMAYEEIHCPIEMPTVAELIALELEENPLGRAFS